MHTELLCPVWDTLKLLCLICCTGILLARLRSYKYNCLIDSLPLDINMCSSRAGLNTDTPSMSQSCRHVFFAILFPYTRCSTAIPGVLHSEQWATLWDVHPIKKLEVHNSKKKGTFRTWDRVLVANNPWHLSELQAMELHRKECCSILF